MPMQLEIKREEATTSGWCWPQMGVGLDWGGFFLCATLDQKGLALGLDEAPTSAGVRLQVLPRSAFEFKLGHQQLSWKNAELPSPLQAMQRLRRSDF